MANPELAPEIDRFYSQVIDESTRLSMSADGRLELLRTQEILRRFLPAAPARVLDVGGGPGVHAEWLVKDGYHVDLIDPIARHVEQASAVCSASLGDARALKAADASYDVVQLLGPLYHLPDLADRQRALREARRVVRPGGLVAAAAINRYASLFEHVAFAHLYKDHLQASISEILRTSMHDGKKGFTLAYFHRAAELADEMRDTGFLSVTVLGIEGPAWSLLKAVEQAGDVPSDELFASALTAARMAEPYPELLAASSHLLAIGQAP
ncbi:class I SAM-dependent methyltransferase [Actinoplanes sp. NPDC026670]|uniref:class I SAM-dependent methyltransferase n=1 Tax=Actinoplanes sp. NPDC026670 TaxID=3154700 RepID=UPI0033E03BDB